MCVHYPVLIMYNCLHLDIVHTHFLHTNFSSTCVRCDDSLQRGDLALAEQESAHQVFWLCNLGDNLFLKQRFFQYSGDPKALLDVTKTIPMLTPYTTFTIAKRHAMHLCCSWRMLQSFLKILHFACQRPCFEVTHIHISVLWFIICHNLPIEIIVCARENYLLHLLWSSTIVHNIMDTPLHIFYG